MVWVVIDATLAGKSGVAYDHVTSPKKMYPAP